MLGTRIIIQFVGNWILSLLSFITLVLIARSFGPKTLGEVNYYLGILGLFLIFSDLGFSRAHIHFVSNMRRINEKISIFLIFKILLLLTFLSISLTYFYFRNPAFYYKNTALIILIIYELFNRMGTSLLYTFEGMQMIVLENLILGISKFGKLLSLAFFIYTAKNIIGLSLSYLIESLIIILLTFYFLRKFLSFKFNKKMLKKYFYYASPFFIIYPLSYIQANSDVVLLRYFWDTTYVGYYSAVISLVAFVKSANGAIMTLFFPKISEIYQNGQAHKIQKYVDAATKYQLLIFIPLFLFLYIFRNEFVLFVLGSQFLPSVEIFSLALIGILILIVSSPYDQSLYASGKHKILVPVTALTVFIAIFLQLIFVPKNIFSFNLFGLGGKGTVLSNNIAWLSAVIIQIYLARRLLKINFRLENYLLLIFGLVTFIFLSVFRISSGTLLVKLGFFLAFISLYYWFCIKRGLLTPPDKEYFRLVVDPKNILKESWQEIKKLSS